MVFTEYFPFYFRLCYINCVVSYVLCWYIQTKYLLYTLNTHSERIVIIETRRKRELWNRFEWIFRILHSTCYVAYILRPVNFIMRERKRTQKISSGICTEHEGVCVVGVSLLLKWFEFTSKYEKGKIRITDNLSVNLFCFVLFSLFYSYF